MPLHIVILAAGQGTRMQSTMPKVLHPIAGQPMLSRVVASACVLQPDAIHVIIGHGGAQIQEQLSSMPVNWVQQSAQLGTGHAVLQALPHIPSDCQVLILSGDVPLIAAETLRTLVHHQQKTQGLTLLLACIDDPKGLGRILRNEQQKICAIIEEKDASLQQRQINEIYSGICCANAADLQRWLPALTHHNAQGEYYLTDIIALAVADNTPIASLHTEDIIEIQGVNDRMQLQMVERRLQLRQASLLMKQGVTLADAARIDIRGEINCGTDVFIDVNTVFNGQNTIGHHTHIGANCVFTNVTIGAYCRIEPNSVLEHCSIGDHSQIGPFARIRPGTILASHCKIGNFVETKNAVFDEHSKASHLSYLGDVTIGKNVNIGAGTITCNYDGAHKHQTIIEDGAFIGSDTQLVAPVTIGRDATIGAGSTIRKNAPAGELTLSLSEQKTIQGWKRPEKEKA